MKTIMSNRCAVVGLAVLTLIVGVSCGKKGGSGAVATPPATTDGDCLDGKCNVGQSYASGVFITYAVGEANYGANHIVAKTAFFGTDKNGYDKDRSQNGIAYYDGQVTMTGSIEVKTGSLYGGVTKPMTERNISAITFSFDWNFGGSSGSYNNGGYTYNPGYSYDNNTGYNNNYGNCGSYSCGCQTQSCNGGGGGSDSSCQLPKGKYSIKTTKKGYWSGYYADFEDIEIELAGGKKASGIFYQGYVEAGNSNKDPNILRAQLVLTKIDGKACNTQVIF